MRTAASPIRFHHVVLVAVEKALDVTRVHRPPFPSFSALVWGSSVKHNPQKVGKDHVMEDEDVIQLVKK